MRKRVVCTSLSAWDTVGAQPGVSVLTLGWGLPKPSPTRPQPAGASPTLISHVHYLRFSLSSSSETLSPNLFFLPHSISLEQEATENPSALLILNWSFLP